jgi:hypothetical protein
MEKRTREGGKVNYELPEYLASKVIAQFMRIQGYYCEVAISFGSYPG